MIFNLDGTTFEAELLFADASHKVASLGPLYEPTAPGTLLEASNQHFFSQFCLFHLVYYFILSTASERMRYCVTRQTNVFMALFALIVFNIFIINIAILRFLIQKGAIRGRTVP